MDDCYSDEAENPLSVGEAPPSMAEEKPRNSENPPPAASSSPDHHGQNTAHAEKDSVEANPGSKFWDDAVITTESEIGRRDRVINQEKFEEIKRKNLKPPLKKKDQKVIISYKVFKSIGLKMITRRKFVCQRKSSCRGMRTEVKMVKCTDMKLVPTFKLCGPYYARKDENGDEDYSGDC